MRASAIVVGDPGFEGEAQMGFGQRDHPVQTFPADRADNAFADRITSLRQLHLIRRMRVVGSQ